MKTWLLLFSTWILICAGMPCADRCTDDSHALQQEATHAPLEQQDKPGDFCSPFCVCICCAVTSEVPQNLAYFTKPVALGRQETRYIYPAAQEHTHAFWQPPRSA